MERALERGASAVLLAGDVVDDPEDRFEAYSALQRAAARLAAGGVRLLAVAGNHDATSLPRLRRAGLELLGEGGRWQRLRLDGDPPVDLLGWSFPERWHRGDPLEAPGLAEALDGREPGVPALGLLHAELDAPGSPYAPVRREALEALGLDAWLLGHRHAPSLGGSPLLGYLGSPQGLDRSETGPHGPWLLRVRGEGVEAEQLPGGPLRWERVEVPLDGAEPGPDELHALLEAALRRRAGELALPGVELVGVTAVLRGRVPSRSAWEAARAELERAEPGFELDGRPWLVVAWEDRTRLALELERLARAPTPAGLLARWLLELERGEGEALLLEAEEVLAPLRRGRWARAPGSLEARELLRGAAEALLERLLAQEAR